MKCVGGPLDGKNYAVKHDQKYIKIALLPALSEIYPGGPLDIEASVTYHYVTYTMRKIRCTPDEIIEYLAPEDWSDAKAIKHQFEK